MALSARYMVDKSALARMTNERVRRRLGPIIDGGLAATCAIIDLEVLYSARSHADYRSIRRRRNLAYDHVAVDETVLVRALEIQSELAKTGHHRVAIPDLVVAAAAELAELTVLHYDRDYDAIARLTGQSVEWVVKRGSVD